MASDFENRIRRVYQAVLRPGDIVVDVGAHVGLHTLPIAAAVAPAGRVYAVEPLPVGRKTLRRRLFFKPRLRRVVEIMDCALGDADGEAEFVIAVHAPAFSGLRERPYDIPTDLRKIPVTVRKFDSLFLELPSLRYVKVDAEGGECDIFRGAAGSLRKFRPLVTFEFGVCALKEYPITPADMAEIWFTLDYKLFDIRGRLLETRADFIKSAEEQNVWDYVATPAEDGDLEACVRGALGNK